MTHDHEPVPPTRPAGEGQRHGAVVSDLHLFTNRTTAHRHMEAINNAADGARLFILNGDTFDFLWCRHKGFEKSIEAAVRWITDLLATHPHCDFVFLLGNHDGTASFKDQLNALESRLHNLHWEEFHLRVGNKLFLHGDALHAGHTMAHLESYRGQWDRPRQKQAVSRFLYWIAAHTGVPRLLSQFHTKRWSARRILTYIHHALGTQAGEIEDVYFGHTHRPFADFEYGNRMFHNTGAALTRSRLTIHRFAVDGERLVFSDGTLVDVREDPSA